MPIKGWDVIVFYFLDEKLPARVAKVPAAILNLGLVVNKK